MTTGTSITSEIDKDLVCTSSTLFDSASTSDGVW